MNASSDAMIFIDKATLKDTLRMYPTLFNTLFPKTTNRKGPKWEGETPRDIISYKGDIGLLKLIEETSPMALDKLFGSNKSKITRSLPSFSSAHFTDDAFVDNVDIYYFLSQGRPFQAFDFLSQDREGSLRGSGTDTLVHFLCVHD